MMAAHRQDDTLLRRMPVVRGRLSAQAPLANLTWFRVGGPAEILFRPADEADLITFMQEVSADIPITVIGVASNLLIRDGGIPGIVIRLGGAFAKMHASEDTIMCGGAALDLSVSRFAADQGLGGLEFLSGIPGTIGGGLRMNAGAYGKEFKDVLIAASAIDRKGVIHHVTADRLGLSYRHCQAPDDWIFLSASLRGTHAVPGDIAKRMAEIQEAREATQPTRTRTGGSTFANTPDAKAWELIDRAGCRGLRHGGAMVSEKHCNFLINTGSASAADIEALGEEVRRRVYAESGILLEWEIRRIGLPLEGVS